MCTILPTTMLDYIELTMCTCVSVFLREREKEGRRDRERETERLTFPSAARADRAIFNPSRRTFLFNFIAWLLGFGPCIVAPPLNWSPIQKYHQCPQVTSQ